ncbi:hypothetical protein [Saccharothrix deserti]|uniref:hypothetical protein n=1 Tax=Saccharothrix deserti TaxID=2593674 RepID=UPI00131C737A|nr:hypothetical protein [Saccharothrix deserti]
MTDLSTRMITIFTALVLVLAATAACQDPDTPTRVTTGQDVPSVTLMVPGRPSDRVTDTAAIELAEEQVKGIESRCREGAGVPGSKEVCLGPLVEAKRAGRTAPCPEGPAVCIFFGYVSGDPTAAVLKVVDSRPGSPACSDGTVTVCRGVVVGADIIAPLMGPPTTTPSRT